MGHRKGPHRHISRAVRRLIYQRDRVCQACGGSGRPTIHHVIPVGQRPDLLNEPLNAVLLCWHCHVQHHARERTHAQKGHREAMIVLSRNARLVLTDERELEADYLVIDGPWLRFRTKDADGPIRTYMTPAERVYMVELRDREVVDEVVEAPSSGRPPRLAVGAH